MLALSTKSLKLIENHLQLANWKKVLPYKVHTIEKLVWVDGTAWYRKAYQLWQTAYPPQTIYKKPSGLKRATRMGAGQRNHD